MKRFITLIAVFATLFTALPTVLSVPDVAAQTQKQATDCKKKYNGEQYSNGSPELKKFQNSDCADKKTGNCYAKSASGSGNYLNVRCTDDPETNGDRAQDGKPDTTSTSGTISDPALQQGSCNKSQCDLIARYVNPTINLLTVLVGIAIVVGIIIGAIQVMTSAGDPQQASRGKNHIRSALIAAVAYVLLYAFIRFIVPRGL